MLKEQAVWFRSFVVFTLCGTTKEGNRMELWKRNLYICWFGSFCTTAGMSLVIPFLPLYIEKLGVHDTSSISRWAGTAFGATFLMAAIVSPLWGSLADKYGRKLMLLRASLGMAIVMTSIGFVQNVYQLVGLRFLMGAVSGFISAAITLVATQTPKEHSGKALGTLSTGAVSGSLLGPLVGGYLGDTIGLRHVFFVTGAFMFLSFLIVNLIQEDKKETAKTTKESNIGLLSLKNSKAVIGVFVTTFLLQLAVMAIQPIVTLYVKQLSTHTDHLALISGFVVAATGISNILAASKLGKVSDRVGPQNVLQICLLIVAVICGLQAFVHSTWQLFLLRFLLGFAMGGLLPSINSYLKKIVPDSITGKMFGYNQTAQYFGNLAGPVIGGQIAGAKGIPYVFLTTSVLLLLNAGWVYYQRHHGQQLDGKAA
ncbi:MFS transporter [Priestia megaterium]|nr:MFS transporter [Priestia megaterium]